jgi:hypothetical protein
MIQKTLNHKSIKTKLLLYGMSNNQIIYWLQPKEQILSFRFIVQLMELLMEHKYGSKPNG